MKKNVSVFFLAIIMLFLQFLFQLPASAEASDSMHASSPYGEHIRLITDMESAPMEIEIIDPASGQRSKKTVDGSYYIPVNAADYINIVCGAEPNSTLLRGGEFYVYFYDHDLNVTWDILDHTDEATGERNRVSIDYLRQLNGFQFTGIPDGSYIRIAKANDHMCRLLIWDGCKTGYPVSALTTCFNNNAEKVRLSADASACIQVPASALYLIAKPGYTFMNLVTSNTSVSEVVASSESRFPAQLVHLSGFYGAGRAKNVRLVKNYDYKTGKYETVMPDSDLSDAVTVVDRTLFESDVEPDLFLEPVFGNIAACVDFTWTAQADIVDCWGPEGTSSGGVGTFHKGVTYHGIPYRSGWRTPNFVGWHVSKQTFMNAANDPDSIFYHNPSKEKPGPYYSLVCSSFGTLVSGFDCPMTNYGIMKNPGLQITKTSEPVIGSLMTNGTSHCFVPIDHSVNTEGTSVLTLAEEIGPITMIRNVYDGIVKTWKGIGLKSAYPSQYIYQITAGSFSPVPYNITSSTIKNGSARPYRGDQSVYTSAMSVRINIKDPEATRLYYQPFKVVCDHALLISAEPCGEARYLEIEPGMAQVILRSATAKDHSFSGADLENGGIYAVWASRDDEQPNAPSNAEFFEWYDLEREKIVYRVEDGTLITDDVFWYAIALGINETDYIKANSKSGLISIPYQAPVRVDGEAEMHSDYSAYAARARIKTPNSVWAFFKKGVFGAYVAGLERVDDPVR